MKTLYKFANKKETSQTQKKKRSRYKHTYLGGSVVTVEYRKDNFVFYERLRLDYDKGCRK